MALPFKNGFELAQAMGFGKMYQASKEQNENNIQMESKNMNKKLIRLTESDLHKIVKESVNRIINEIGNTDKGQDALGQVRGRADKRSKLLGGAIGNKYRKISRDAQDKAYSQGKKHGFDIYDPNGAYDKGISKGYEKALKESDNWEDNESTIDYWRQAEDNYLMQEKLPRGWEKHKCDDVFGGFIYTDGDYNEYYKDQYGRFQPLDNEF
jgi:hypothetical protein